WAQRLDVEWAQQQQREVLEQRRLRADLRTALRRLGQEPEDFDALLNAASAAGQLRQYDDAFFFLSEAQRLRPRDPQVYSAKGQAYLASGRYDRCLDAVDTGLRLAPDDLELNLLRLDVDAVLGWAQEAQPRSERLLARYG